MVTNSTFLVYHGTSNQPLFSGRCIYVCSMHNMLSRGNQSTKGGKDQEMIQSRTTPDPGYHMDK